MGCQVAALYVESDGIYSKLEGVDPWGVEREARAYPGPHPVVAHPPCGPWGRLRALCTQQDPTLAVHAVAQLALFGGVLEHPEASRLWPALGLPEPDGLPRRVLGRAMWSTVVDQVDFGHPCRKRTWLLFAGVERSDLPPRPPPGSPVEVVGDTADWRHAAGVKVASKLTARHTPPRFAAWLLDAVRAASGRGPLALIEDMGSARG